MNDVTYELPLNERVRTLMRLEHLFRQIDHSLTATSVWDNRSMLIAIIDILHTTSRADLKTELIKELERLSSNLAPLTNSNSVDQDKLNSILADIRATAQQLHSLQGLIAQKLRDNEFINSIKQRCSLPGGTSDFDLPIFHCWLQKNIESRRMELRHWQSELDLLRKSVNLILTLIRESARSTRVIAQGGFYQQPLDANAPFQLVRATLPAGSDYYAEISGGKHRVTIRFLTMTTESRPAQIEKDIEFRLTNCVI